MTSYPAVWLKMNHLPIDVVDEFPLILVVGPLGPKGLVCDVIFLQRRMKVQQLNAWHEKKSLLRRDTLHRGLWRHSDGVFRQTPSHGDISLHAIPSNEPFVPRHSLETIQ